MRDYHRENNIAKQLYALERELFGYGEKAKLLLALRPYYTGIEETAHLIQSHSEKQNFLKSLRKFLQGLQSEGRRPARRSLHAERDRALHDP